MIAQNGCMTRKVFNVLLDEEEVVLFKAAVKFAELDNRNERNVEIKYAPFGAKFKSQKKFAVVKISAFGEKAIKSVKREFYFGALTRWKNDLIKERRKAL